VPPKNIPQKPLYCRPNLQNDPRLTGQLLGHNHLICLVSVRNLLAFRESGVIQGWWPDSEGPQMWTKKNRGRYDRSSLRYPSDLTDDEWAHVEPLIPPAKRGGNKRRVDVREVMNGIMYVLSGRFRRICLRAARCSTISTCGAGTALWIACITPSTSSAANKAIGKQVQPLPSSTAKA
jgi:hypothetical protein